MKVINKTHFDTRDLKLILNRCADLVLKDEKKKRVVVTVVYNKRRDACSGCASIGGYYAKIRINKHNPMLRDFAWVAVHEFRHLNGWSHREMKATYDSNDLAPYSWALGYPLRVRQPKRKIRPGVSEKLAAARKMHARAVTRLKRAQTIEKKWRMKIRYYEKKESATQAPEQIAAGGPQ